MMSTKCSGGEKKLRGVRWQGDKGGEELDGRETREGEREEMINMATPPP